MSLERDGGHKVNPEKPIGDLAGRTAIVVGASRGLGRGIASALAEAGAPVIAVARDPASLESLANGPHDIKPAPGDASDPAVAGRLLDDYDPEIVVLVAGAVPFMRPLHQVHGGSPPDHAVDRRRPAGSPGVRAPQRPNRGGVPPRYGRAADARGSRRGRRRAHTRRSRHTRTRLPPDWRGPEGAARWGVTCSRGALRSSPVAAVESAELSRCNSPPKGRPSLLGSVQAASRPSNSPPRSRSKDDQ